MGSLSSPIAALEDGKEAQGSDRIPISRSPFGYKSDFHITPAYIMEYVDKNLWRGLIVNETEIKGPAGVLVNDGGTLRTLETYGSGKIARTVAPEFTKPKLGEAQATSINGVTIVPHASRLDIADGKTLQAKASLTLDGKDGVSLKVSASTVIQGNEGAILDIGSGGSVAYTEDKLSDFGKTSSAELREVIDGTTGKGELVFADGAQFTKPIIDDATLNRPKFKDARANSFTADIIGVSNALILAQDGKIEIGGTEVAEIKDGVLRLGSEEVPVYVYNGSAWSNVSTGAATLAPSNTPDRKDYLAQYAKSKYQDIRVSGFKLKDIEVPCDAQTLADLMIYLETAKAKPETTFEWVQGSGSITLSSLQIAKIVRYTSVWLQLCNLTLGRVLARINSGKVTEAKDIDTAEWPARDYQFKPVEV